jgi:hypothetical protein
MLTAAVLVVRGLYRLVFDDTTNPFFDTSSSSLTLIYFDGRGRAEPIRFVMGLAGVRVTQHCFVDNFITFQKSSLTLFCG